IGGLVSNFGDLFLGELALPHVRHSLGWRTPATSGWYGWRGAGQSRQIYDEWKRSVLRDRPDLSADQLNRTSDLMDRAIPDALVTGHEAMAENLRLPDPGDRHVLAAAIRCGASAIVTFNEKDFPAEALE
ncbi:PIN domain-containing protein, partial [Piscinibacter sakaiensis]|uniref:PIN domain-containing protein n=1 Tax=Piscinibacter sakaiensis TaxID=1547922 RepID=UPI003F76639E